MITKSPTALRSRIESVTKLWNILLPPIEPPTREWLATRDERARS